MGKAFIVLSDELRRLDEEDANIAEGLTKMEERFSGLKLRRRQISEERAEIQRAIDGLQ